MIRALIIVLVVMMGRRCSWDSVGKGEVEVKSRCFGDAVTCLDCFLLLCMDILLRVEHA